MKHLIITTLFALLGLNFCFGQSFESIPDLLEKNGKDLGIVSYLTFVKSISEANMMRLSERPEYKKQNTKKTRINSQYNLIKLFSDQLINQISADMYASNNLKIYKKINLYLKNPNGKVQNELEKYDILIKRIDSLLISFLSIDFGPGVSVATIDEITGVIELGHSIITDARDFREKKIQSIISLMKELKILKISELNPQKKE